MQSIKKLTKEHQGSFLIRPRKNKDGSVRWYLRFRYNNEEVSVPKSLFSFFGFKDSMTVEQAKKRAQRLNKERGQNTKQYIKSAIRFNNEVESDKVFFPEDLVEEFLEYLDEKTHGTEYRFKKVLSHFGAVQRLIKDTKLLPQDYSFRSSKIYNWCRKSQYSLDYTQSIIRVLNLWGTFVSMQEGRFFDKVPNPKGIVRAQIKAANKKSAGKRNPSKPLTPQKLKNSKDKLKPEYYNWLYLSLWFGLRPTEVDRLNDEEYTVLEETEEGLLTLSIYQTKLQSVEDEARWKTIPILYPEQGVALDIIEEGTFKRPSHPKLIQKAIGPEYNLYAGRKGFTDLMLERGQNLVDVSQWLGHSSIERTWKHYKDKKRVSFTKTKGMIKKVG